MATSAKGMEDLMYINGMNSCPHLKEAYVRDVALLHLIMQTIDLHESHCKARKNN